MGPDAAQQAGLEAPPRRPRGPRFGLGGEGARALLVATLSTIIVFGLIGYVVVNSTGWPRFQETFLNSEIFWESLPKLINKFWVNVRLFLTAEVLILVFGLVLAVLRSLSGPALFPVRLLATVYVDVFRAIPGLLIIFILGLGVPALRIPGVPDDEFFWAVIALTLVYSAYVSEVYRSGIDSVHPSQDAAARSLGLSRWQGLRFVVLPQAVRRVIPPLLNDFIGLQKDTVLVAVDRRRRGVPPDPGPPGRHVQLHALPRDGTDLPRSHDPARPVHRLPACPREAPSQRGRRRRDALDGAAGDPRHGWRQLVDAVPALSIEGLHKSFGDLEVLRGIDLDVAEHEVVALIGASGSGKSTLLRCVNLIEPIDAGRIRIKGEEITAKGVKVDRIRRRIGIVYQAYNLFPHMSVMDNVTLAPRKVLGRSRADAERDATELLTRFGLAEKARDYPDSLSGGQQQRVAIVRALAMGPDLLLLDEVTSALDPELVAEVLNVVRELAGGGMTMVIATHEMGFARDIANRVCFLDAGRILEQGPPAQIFSNPQEPRTRQFLNRIIEAGRL